MSELEIIESHEVDKLKFVLNHVAGQQYIDCVQQLQEVILDNVEQIDVEVEHHFAPHVYGRQMNAKAGTLLIGKMHKTEHLLIFMSGICTVMTDGNIELISSPCVLKTKIGTKRVMYFHEDTKCITIHPTEKTDIDDIESDIIVPFELEKVFSKNSGVIG